MQEFIQNIRNGLIDENPVYVMLLGMCPAIGITTAVINGIGMGLATTFVLLGSNIVISLLRKIIPEEVRIPSFIVIIATFVTIVDLLMAAYAPDLHGALGVFIPLIVVNCLILQRAEAKASKSNLVQSIGDALGMGLGFTLAITILSFFRELLGSGSVLGYSLFSDFAPLRVMNESAGGFITLALILGFLNWYKVRSKGGSKA
ncbi:MAG: electron transport complex subunit RsxE [Clostridia bacterium]